MEVYESCQFLYDTSSSICEEKSLLIAPFTAFSDLLFFLLQAQAAGPMTIILQSTVY